MEEIIEEYIIEEGADGKPKKTVKRTTYKNGVPISEEFEDVDEIPEDAMETEEIVEEYEIEEGKNQPPKTLKKTVYKTVYENGVPVKVPITVEDETTRDISLNPYMKLAPTIIETIVKYAHPDAGDHQDDLDNLISQVNEISKVIENPSQKQTESDDRGVVSDMITSAVANSDNPYLKLAPSIIEMIVKYAIPNASDKDGKVDYDNLMSEVTKITELMAKRESPETVTTENRNASAPAQPESDNRDAVANGESPYLKLAPTIIEMIVKYAIPNASDKDGKIDYDRLMGEVTKISDVISKRESPETETTETKNTTTTAPSHPKSDDRGVVSDMITSVVSNSDNPYLKLAPSIIEMIVKYALPNASENDGKTDYDGLMSQVTKITELIGKRETPETDARNVKVVKGGEKVIEGEEVVEEYLIEEDEYGRPKKTVKRTTFRNGLPISEEYDEVSTIPDDAMETEEIVEEYEVEESKDNSTIKKTVYKNGRLTEETTENKPLKEYRFPAPPSDMVALSNVELPIAAMDDGYGDGLPSISEEDESQPMENNRMMDTTSPAETKFRKRQLPKRSSSIRLSAELKAAVAAEIAKLENEINDETKYIPRPRKQSITQNLNRKDSKASIKAMAEGCLVRRPSNASSIRSNHSVVEDWSGPVFEKKVFEVVVEHTPQLPDEVKLTIGDLVEVKQVFEDGWAYGINTATKMDGTFPVICLGEEREPNKNGRYVPRLIRVYQAREEAGKKEIEDEEKFKQDLTEFAKKKKEYKLKRQSKKYKN